jgi:hypothetical protein
VSSADLDPGYLVTHDDPAHAATELAKRQAAMRALALLPFVWWRALVGDAQYKAVVTRVYSPDCADLLVLPEASIDLGSGFGVPYPLRSVVRGSGHLCWQTELDA